MTATETGDPDARLSDLRAEVRENPLFRRGYNHGYSDRVRDERRSQWDEERRRPAGVKAATRSYGVTAGDLRGCLSPGDTVTRDVGRHDDTYTAGTPCCGRQVTVPASEDATVVCCRCRITATVTLAAEDPDGYSDEPVYVAVFTITSTTVVIARHRAGKWEK